MPDKISISWDEVQSSHVDEKIRARDASERLANRPPSSEETGGILNLLYNTFVYMALAGLVGGFGAWCAGEATEVLIYSPLETYIGIRLEQDRLVELANTGEISSDDARQQISELYQRHSTNPFVATETDSSLGDAEREEKLDQLFVADRLRQWVRNMLWYVGIGLVLSFCLAVGEQAVSQNWRGVMVEGAYGLVAGVIAGFIISLVIDIFFNFLLYVGALVLGEDSLVAAIVARSIAWGVFGAMLAVAPGVAMRNPKRMMIGLGGGFIGGLVGGFLFDPVAMVTTDVISRSIGIIAVGVMTGLGSGAIEAVAKSGWLKVVGGMIAGKQFVLYKNTTNIGSAPSCEVYLFKDPQVAPVHAVLRKTPGGYFLEDAGSQAGTFVNGNSISRQKLSNMDTVTIGGTTFRFQERSGG